MTLEFFIKIFIFFLIVIEVEDDKLRFSFFGLNLNLVDPVFIGQSVTFIDFNVNKNWFS